MRHEEPMNPAACHQGNRIREQHVGLAGQRIGGHHVGRGEHSRLLPGAPLAGKHQVGLRDDTDRRVVLGNHERVNAIVENILQLSRPERSIPQTIRLADWLDKFVDEFVQSGTCSRDEISCSMTDTDAEIRIDPGLLHQVVWNLCQNAVQHGKPNEDVRLTLVTGLSAHIDAPTLDIIDNGPGIPADMADKIFEPFFTTRTSGTGLGLYIARDICESNNMRLEYIHKPGQGSCFRITFPSARHLPVTALA